MRHYPGLVEPTAPERRLEADVVGARMVELFENVLSRGCTVG